MNTCKKEEVETPNNTEARINKFLSDLSIKTDDYLVESTYVIWNIEATLNYTKCDVSLKYDSVFTDTFFVQNPITQGNVLFSDVREAYFELEDILMTAM